MPEEGLVVRITVDVPAEVAEALARRPRTLLIGRRAYVRAVLAAVAAQAPDACATQDRRHPEPSDG